MFELSMPPKQTQSRNLYQFHYGSQLFSTETCSQRQIWLAFQTRTQAKTEQIIRNNQNCRNTEDHTDAEPRETGTNSPNQLGFDEGPLWEDTEEIMNKEDQASRACLWSLHQEMIQQQRHRNWNDVLKWLLPAYLHLKKVTSNWHDNFSGEVCDCPAAHFKTRELDLIDLMSKSFIPSLTLRLEQNRSLTHNCIHF
jgi:hypothetical protein